MFIDYMPCRECVDFAMTCVKCGKCGRKFEDGILVNGDKYPGYDPDFYEEEDGEKYEGFSGNATK